MSSAKESLRNTIELLSEKEARQIMQLARIVKDKKEGSITMRHLAIDGTFTVPLKRPKSFRIVQPIKGRGCAASKLLVEDRR